jgi:hypothetical protein
MADWDTFEVFPVEYGSGPSKRVCLHVRVRMWNRPQGFHDKDGVICLTADACDPDEFDMHIDELIAELQDLKKIGRRKFAKVDEVR